MTFTFIKTHLLKNNHFVFNRESIILTFGDALYMQKMSHEILFDLLVPTKQVTLP